jgi:hypothetical protein
MIGQATFLTYPEFTEEEKEAMDQLAQQMQAVADKALASDRQVGGEHYRAKTIQPWTAMESWMAPEQFEGYLRGNVIKYIARYKDKNGIEDVYKARHYLERLTEHLERGNA